MENNRDDLVVILAGYKDKMERFFQSNPGMRSRIAHHIDFPDYSDAELLAIANLMLAQQNYRFSEEAENAFAEYIKRRMQQAHFPMRGRFAMPWIAPGCVRPIACLPGAKG